MPKSKSKKTAKKTVKRKASPQKKKESKETEGTEVDEGTSVPSDTSVPSLIKPKKKFFSLSIGKKKKDKDDGYSASSSAPKTGMSKFFASVNNMGMGKQRVAMIQSLAMMMGAGLPLIDALNTLEKEIRHKATKKIVRRITSAVESGVALWRAMEQQYLFSPYELALVRIGEEAGNLARNLELLSVQQEKDRALRAKVKMAMIYPAIVMVLMFIIVMGLGMFVLPNLIQVLLSLNAELPITTRAVIYVTNGFTEYGAIGIPVMIVGFITLILLSKFTRFRAVTQWCAFHVPGIGTLARSATIARFGVILGGLLQAGVPLTESLRSLENVTYMVAYKKFYKKLLEHIMLGDSFSKSFEAIPNTNKLLPISVQQLVITGEKSGTLSETLIKISEIYERKAEETADKLPVILEPMLLLFIGGLVGTIAFAIITPIYSVVGNVGR